MLGYVIYGIIEKNLYYLCIQQDKLSSNDMSFQDATFDGFPGIGIPEVLINIMYCCGFSKEGKKISF